MWLIEHLKLHVWLALYLAGVRLMERQALSASVPILNTVP